MARLSIVWSSIALAALLLAQAGCTTAPANSEGPTPPPAATEAAAPAAANETAPPASSGAPLDYSREAFVPGEPVTMTVSDEVTAVSVATRVGNVAAEVGADTQVHIEVTKLVRAGLSPEQKELADRVTITPRVVEGALTLEPKTPEPLSSYAEVADFDVTIRLPVSWAAEAKGTEAASIPRLAVKNVSGNISAANARCDLTITTISGLVLLRALEGEAVVHTTEGDVKASGCAWVRAVLNSTGGHITAEPARLGPGDELRLSSSIGNLKVVAPADADCCVEADTTAGRVSSNAAALRSGIRYSGRSLRAYLGEGAGLLQLRSTTGNIQIDMKPEVGQQDSREDGAT